METKVNVSRNAVQINSTALLAVRPPASRLSSSIYNSLPWDCGWGGGGGGGRSWGGGEIGGAQGLEGTKEMSIEGLQK